MVAIAAGLVIGWFLVFVARIGGARLWPLVIGARRGDGHPRRLVPRAARRWCRRPARERPRSAPACSTPPNVASSSRHRAPLVLVSALVSLAPAGDGADGASRWAALDRGAGRGLTLALGAGVLIAVGVGASLVPV
jgi:hypothetical protein